MLFRWRHDQRLSTLNSSRDRVVNLLVDRAEIHCQECSGKSDQRPEQSKQDNPLAENVGSQLNLTGAITARLGFLRVQAAPIRLIQSFWMELQAN